jgi:DNA polymerase-4
MYRAVSAQIREIFYEYTDLDEPPPLDGAFLDVAFLTKLQNTIDHLMVKRLAEKQV